MSATEPLPTHQSIEEAFGAPKAVLSRLPDSIESREAARLLDVAESLTHQTRERAKEETS